MEKKTRSKNQNEGPKPCPRSTGKKSTTDSAENMTNEKSGSAKWKSPAAHSGIKMNFNTRKTTVVKPFSFDRKKKEQGTPSCSTEKKVEKEVASEPKDAEGKVQVIMDTLKISRSEECNSEESSSSITKPSKILVDEPECVKKEHYRCGRATKLLTNLFVEKPARAKSPSKGGSPAVAKRELGTVIKKDCTRGKRNTPDPLKTPKLEAKSSKDKSHLKESLTKSSVKKESTRCLRTAKPQAEPPKDQMTDIKTREKSPAETSRSDESKSQPTKAIKAKPACSKIAKLQTTKSEMKATKASQAEASIEVQVAAVDSTVTEITQNTYSSKESVVISSQTSNTESFCVTEESVSNFSPFLELESDLKLAKLTAVEENHLLLNGSESGTFYVAEDECNLSNGKNIVSEILEEAKYEAESFIQKNVQETQKSTSKIPRKTQGTLPVVNINGNIVKGTIAEQFSFENRCPNSMDQPTNHEESLLVN